MYEKDFEADDLLTTFDLPHRNGYIDPYHS